MQQQNSTKKRKTSSKQLGKETAFIEDIVAQVSADFSDRRAKRLSLERQWELNVNFLRGNQYRYINGMGEIGEDNQAFYWQNRRVFNHVAPIIETRTSKFSRIAPTIGVRPASDDDSAVTGASNGEKLLEEAFKKQKVYDVVKTVTDWSETCGSGFYKIVWDNAGGKKVGVLDGTDVYEGDVAVLPVSPFEIFPDNLNTENLQDCQSIIHAKAMPVSLVQEKYGVKVKGGSVGVFSLDDEKGAINKSDSQVMQDAVIVIERYEKPCSQYPKGRLITVAGDKLLYYGELPYLNGENKCRQFPFVKQDCISVAGSFFGTSIIERLIPVQRAFNAVKNRKHEFLNRLSMGVMKVEDGSVDVDDLAEEGLSPGKVLVYRQGSNAPEMLEGMSMPNDFNNEEERLLNEFVIISGVSNVTSSSSNASLSSGTALELLIEQDNERLMISAENIRKSYLDIARHIIRLYVQFLTGVKAITVRNVFGKTGVYYVDGSTIGTDDVYLENENELLYTERQRKEVLLTLYNSGLLADEQGKVRQATKEKLLSLLGYKDLDYRKGLSRLQEEKAQTENEKMLSCTVQTEEIDDDEIHAETHIRYVLSEYGSLTEEQKQRFFAHIKGHKQKQII
ncbi:MAG: hypothetical protein IJZ73_03960 [Clostridia bacterium]|nr:hypothetical protein [Clostridia bacterium]